MQCEESEKYLLEFSEGGLSDLERQAVDQHLQQCEECTGLLSDIWEMQLASSGWKDQPVPSWNRRAAFFGPRQPMSLPWLNLASVAVSAMVLVVVLLRVEVVQTDSGITFSYAGGGQAINAAELDRKLNAMHLENQMFVSDTTDQLNARQVATNQLLLRTMLQTSRRERRDDLMNVMSAWDNDRQRQEQMTEESLLYLIRNQAEDKRELRDLSTALRGLNIEEDNNL